MVAGTERGRIRKKLSVGLGGGRPHGGQVPWEMGFQGCGDTGDKGIVQRPGH